MEAVVRLLKFVMDDAQVAVANASTGAKMCWRIDMGGPFKA